MKLHFIKSGSGHPLIILHGLFGMLDNWKSIARQLENNFTVYLIDQRNHGKSPHVPEHSYILMAQDLNDFFIQHNISSANIIGHSMGGKTAMQFALNFPDKVDKLMVVDMGIKRYPGGHDAIFEALQSLKLSEIHSRKDAEVALSTLLSDIGVQQFLLKNLTRTSEGVYHWKFNLEALFANYNNEILGPVKATQSYSGAVEFVRGENSKYIINSDWDAIQNVFPNATLITVANAGHWVHADNPVELLKSINSFFL